VDEIQIDLATELDVPGIRALLEHVESPFDVEAELTRSYAKLWVARSDATQNRPLALLLAWEAGDSADLIDLVVEPAARRRGLGRALVQVLLRHARERGLSRVVLEVRLGNAGARRLYESLGFSEVGERRKYYSDGENAMLYEFRT
jgi:ribosomal-protein-alanine N-acetyltransferase